MDPKPPTIPIPEPGPKILSFEEFVSPAEAGVKVSCYNNFFLYFIGNELAKDYYRTTEHYKRFEREHPEMATSLCDKIQNQRDQSHGTSQSLKPFDRDLYEAYKIMRRYGASDRELFA